MIGFVTQTSALSYGAYRNRFKQATAGASPETYYPHRDHLGSPELVTNAAGAQVVNVWVVPAGS